MNYTDRQGSITRLEKKYFLALIELKGTYNLYGWTRVVLTGLGVKKLLIFQACHCKHNLVTSDEINDQASKL